MHTGVGLGIASFACGLALDKEQKTLPESKLFLDAVSLAAVNLLIIGPIIHHALLPYTVPRSVVRRARDAAMLVVVHSGLYALAHRAMHRIAAIRPFHRDHHRFRKVVIPTAANAVSLQEFLFAYMLPFVIGTSILKPDASSLNAAAAIVSACNLIVHSPHLEHLPYPRQLVSPHDHLSHHRSRRPCYSAPTLAWERLLSS